MLKKIFKYFCIIVAIELIVVVFQIKPYIMPSPSMIAQSMITNYQLLIVNMMTTITEVFLGLALAVIISILIGYISFFYPQFQKMINRILVIIQTVPAVIIAPIFIFWFGFSLTSKVLLITIYGCYPIIVNIQAQIAAINPDLILYFKTLKATRKQVYQYLVYPTILTSLYDGLTIAATYSIATAIVGELMGAKSGIGVILMQAIKNYNYPLVYAIGIIIVVTTLLILRLISKLKKIHIKNLRSLKWKNYYLLYLF